MDKERLARYFAFLDDLRKSGVTNMFGAAQYVKDEFDLSNREVKMVLSAWMQTFSHEETPAERAMKASVQ